MDYRTKKWNIESQPGDEIEELSRELAVGPLTARVLWNRGYRKPEEAGRFLRKDDTYLYDPFLLPDMEAAVERIARAVRDGERIAIFGDYDVDGVTATCILTRYLTEKGADIWYYIPGRLDEGYGLSCESVSRIAERGTRLIVTVDTGTTALDEAERIRELGMDLVVTDHHECREVLPAACAVVNPRRTDSRYPFSALAGVGVAFKLICALETSGASGAERRRLTAGLLRRFAEETAIGTIADVMPLTDENRLIVSLGLSLLRDTEKPGLTALMEQASVMGTKTRRQKKITAGYIGFTIAPRINAVGRISRASRAVELLLTDSREEAEELAKELCEANRERQEAENEIAEEALIQVEERFSPEKDCILILEGEHWHHGIIGIVASRLTERYHVPVILVSYEGSGEIGKGSGRSVPGFHLVDSLTACAPLLERYGGHALAAGLSIRRENLPLFREKMTALAKEAFDGKVPPQVLKVDCLTQPEDLTLENAEELLSLEPFGTGNPTPLFCLEGAVIDSVIALSQGKHTKLLLSLPETENLLTAIVFGTKPNEFPYRSGDTVDVVYQMDVNEYLGVRSVQMLLSDIRPHGEGMVYLTRECALYSAILRGEAANGFHYPTRAECSAVWRGIGALGEVCRYLELSELSGVSLHQVRLILDLFRESGLIRVTESDPYSVTVRTEQPAEKVDLNETALAKRLKELDRNHG